MKRFLLILMVLAVCIAPVMATDYEIADYCEGSCFDKWIEIEKESYDTNLYQYTGSGTAGVSGDLQYLYTKNIENFADLNYYSMTLVDNGNHYLGSTVRAWRPKADWPISDSTTVTFKLDSSGGAVLGTGEIGYTFVDEGTWASQILFYILTDDGLDIGAATGAHRIYLSYGADFTGGSKLVFDNSGQLTAAMSGIMASDEIAFEYISYGNTYRINAATNTVSLKENGHYYNLLESFKQDLYIEYTGSETEIMTNVMVDKSIDTKYYASNVTIWAGGDLDIYASDGDMLSDDINIDVWNKPIKITIESPFGDSWTSIFYWDVAPINAQDCDIVILDGTKPTKSFLAGSNWSLYYYPTMVWKEGGTTNTGYIKDIELTLGQTYLANGSYSGYTCYPDAYSLPSTWDVSYNPTFNVWCYPEESTLPTNASNVYVTFIVDDGTNTLNGVSITMNGETKLTNYAGWARFEVPKNATYTYEATKNYYVGASGGVTVTTESVQVELSLAHTGTLPPTTATPTPYATTSPPGTGADYISDTSRQAARESIASVANLAPALLPLFLILLVLSAMKKV